MLNTVDIIFPHLIHRYYIFGMIIFNFEQRCKFSVNGGLLRHFISHLNIYFMITDYIQKALHQFDMHIGGILGSNIGIAETDKTKFIISSIMEEAISSSQMEGASYPIRYDCR